jgi:hypothetical protein
MREFDKYAALASVIVQSQVVQVIPPMQTIHLTLQDQTVPACLSELKRLELLYMSTTLQTLNAFQEPTPNAEAITAGVLQARQYYDQYAVELVRLLGVTLTAPAITPAGMPTP